MVANFDIDFLIDFHCLVLQRALLKGFKHLCVSELIVFFVFFGQLRIHDVRKDILDYSAAGGIILSDLGSAAGADVADGVMLGEGIEALEAKDVPAG